jgi:hypothetical protein
MPNKRMIDGDAFNPNALAVLLKAFDDVVAELELQATLIGNGPQRSSSSSRSICVQSCGP